VRWIVHGVLFMALAAGIFGLLPRLGGLTHDAAGLRHARPAFPAAAVLGYRIVNYWLPPTAAPWARPAAADCPVPPW
jgi:hypothetical protein